MRIGGILSRVVECMTLLGCELFWQQGAQCHCSHYPNVLAEFGCGVADIEKQTDES